MCQALDAGDVFSRPSRRPTAHPEAFAGKTVGQSADHYAELIGAPDRNPVVIGASFGGLFTRS